MIPMASPMAHDTDASTGTNTGTKSHIILLNNHLNMTNAMVSLMVSSTSCDRKHVTAMKLPTTKMPINATHAN